MTTDNWFKNLFGKKPEPDIREQKHRFSDDELESAALDVLHPQFSSYFIEFETKIERIKAYRDWLKTQDDKKVIAAYNHWLDYFEKEAYRERQDKEDAPKRAEKWDAERREKEARLQPAKQYLPKPEIL